jgi:hypothetical protein
MRNASAPRPTPTRAPAERSAVHILRVVTPVKREGEEKTFWQRIGMAFENYGDDGHRKSISIRLNALPVNGEMVLFPDDDRDQDRERDRD